jgi:hypothetical protein
VVSAWPSTAIALPEMSTGTTRSRLISLPAAGRPDRASTPGTATLSIVGSFGSLSPPGRAATLSVTGLVFAASGATWSLDCAAMGVTVSETLSTTGATVPVAFVTTGSVAVVARCATGAAPVSSVGLTRTSLW